MDDDFKRMDEPKILNLYEDNFKNSVQFQSKKKNFCSLKPYKYKIMTRSLNNTIEYSNFNFKRGNLVSFGKIEYSTLYYNILVNIRVPRVLYAVAIGGGLSVAGAIFQGILINPLAEPYILGVSGGAAFGAVIAITLNLGIFLSQIFSLTGSVIVIGIVFLLAKKLGDFEPQTLLLIGVMIASFFSALILIVIMKC